MDSINKYEGKSVSELVQLLSELKDKLDRVNDYRTKLNKELELLSKVVLPNAMNDEGISSVKVDGVGRVTLRSDIYARIPAANREAAMEWLREHGHGGLIKETVHHGTLRAAMKELLREGKELPPDTLIQVTPYDMAVLTRSK